MVPRDDKYWSLQNLKIVVSFLFIAVFKSPLKNANKKEKKNNNNNNNNDKTNKREQKDVHL